MLRSNSRRRHSGSSHLCLVATASVLLLVLSLAVLHSRLSSSPLHLSDPSASLYSTSDLTLLDDAQNDAFDGGSDDRIDILDDIEDETVKATDVVTADPDDEDAESDDVDRDPVTGGYFWDHVLGVKRKAFGRRQPSDGRGGDVDAIANLDENEDDADRSKVAFSSDDLPVDEGIRIKMDSIQGIEDALLLKVNGNSRLRDGWAKWFEAKGRFLRQDKMFSSSWDLLNPMNHPLLQDPDIPGLTTLTRGDKFMRKALWKEMERTPFGDGGNTKRPERRGLDLEKKQGGNKGGAGAKTKQEHIYPNGQRWGYYPGIDTNLSFSDFMDKFISNEQCSLRVFMVWNSPPWAYGVRHQRGLESLLRHHKDACVVVFTEMMELDFFRDFVKDGFKIAVAMPNLDELLRGTPAHEFSSVWNEWRKTKHYPIHYSELIRLAALYKYGGIYLDSDVIVLNPLSALRNSIGVEDKTSGNLSVNGAVMSFTRHSPFIMECMREFHATYDETSLRANGAKLLSRVLRRLTGGRKKPDVKLEHSYAFFPISSQNIERYFAAPGNEFERSEQDVLFEKILGKSMTFHFWNGMTSALVPQPGSLVERLINRYCIYCLDVL